MLDKLTTYQVALDKTIKELAIRRTELSTLARKTVEDLEASIPGLVKKASRLQIEIANLEKIIEEKTVKANADNIAVINQYRQLEDSLQKEYEEKRSSLAIVGKLQKDRDEQYFLNLEQLKKDQENLVSERVSFSNSLGEKIASLAQDISDFNTRRDSEIRALDKQKDDMKRELEESHILREELLAKEKELSNKFEELSNKIKQVDDVIAKNSKYQELLDAAIAKEAKNQDRESGLNQANVTLMADIKRNNARTSALDSREEALNKREENLRIAEASLSEG